MRLYPVQGKFGDEAIERTPEVWLDIGQSVIACTLLVARPVWHPGCPGSPRGDSEGPSEAPGVRSEGCSEVSSALRARIRAGQSLPQAPKRRDHGDAESVRCGPSKCWLPDPPITPPLGHNRPRGCRTGSRAVGWSSVRWRRSRSSGRGRVDGRVSGRSRGWSDDRAIGHADGGLVGRSGERTVGLADSQLVRLSSRSSLVHIRGFWDDTGNSGQIRQVRQHFVRPGSAKCILSSTKSGLRFSQIKVQLDQIEG